LIIDYSITLSIRCITPLVATILTPVGAKILDAGFALVVIFTDGGVVPTTKEVPVWRVPTI
jgi:hypothetical protein